METPLTSATINIGVLYKTGVIILTDSQVSAGNKNVGDIRKIYQLTDNTIMSISGDLGFAQKTMIAVQSDLLRVTAYYEQAVRDREKETIEEMKKSINRENKTEEDFKKEKDIERLMSMTPEGKRLIFSKPEVYLQLVDNVLYVNSDVKKELDGKVKYKDGSYVLQRMDPNLLFEVGSVTAQVAKKVEESTKTLTGLVAGYDKNGPRLFEIYSNGAFIEKDKFAAMGSGLTEARSVLKEYYCNDITKDTALLLAVYSGLRAAEEDVGVNENFQIGIVEMSENSKIATCLLDKNEVDSLKERAKKSVAILYCAK